MAKNSVGEELRWRGQKLEGRVDCERFEGPLAGKGGSAAQVCANKQTTRSESKRSDARV